MSLLGDVGKVVRANPLIAMASLASFVPRVRAWMERQVDYEEAVLKIRAVMPEAEADAQISLAHELAGEWTAGGQVGDEQSARIVALRLLLQHYCKTGEVWSR